MKFHGLCQSHGIAAKYSKRHEWLIPEHHQRPRCVVEDCDQPSYNNKTGFCKNHQDKLKHGTLHLQDERHREEMEEPGDENTISGRIKNARIRVGLTRAELANLVQGNQRNDAVTVRILERNPEWGGRASSVANYANALGVTVESLYPEGFRLPREDDPTDGGQFKRHRMLRGMRLEDVSQILGVSRERVRQLELTRRFSYKTHNQVVKLLGIPATVLSDPVAREFRSTPRERWRQSVIAWGRKHGVADDALDELFSLKPPGHEQMREPEAH